MGRYYNDIRELVGHTPLLKLNHLAPGNGVNLFAKLEYMNPGGSMKDRIGLEIIKEAEESGALQPGGTIIEATAGNTGIGLALAAVQRGYHLKVVVSSKFSEEKRNLIQALGGEIILSDPEAGIDGSIAEAEELGKKIPGSFVAHQFQNPANPNAHHATGREIREDLDGKVDMICAGAGSGGSITGIAEELKGKDPAVRIVLADPVGSIIGGGEAGHYSIEGIGNHFIPAIYDQRRSLIDKVDKITDDDAYFFVRVMSLYEGVIGASSSGAALAAAVEESYDLPAGSNVVAIISDRTDRYMTENVYHFEKKLSDFHLSPRVEQFAKEHDIL